jgi:hypothetical protein
MDVKISIMASVNNKDRVMLDASARRFQAHRIYLRVAAAKRWAINRHDLVARTGKANATQMRDIDQILRQVRTQRAAAGMICIVLTCAGNKQHHRPQHLLRPPPGRHTRRPVGGRGSAAGRDPAVGELAAVIALLTIRHTTYYDKSMAFYFGFYLPARNCRLNCELQRFVKHGMALDDVLDTLFFFFSSFLSLI